MCRPGTSNRCAGEARVPLEDAVAGAPDGDVAAQLRVFGTAELLRPRRALIRPGASFAGEVGDQLGTLVEVVTPSAGGQGRWVRPAARAGVRWWSVRGGAR